MSLTARGSWETDMRREGNLFRESPAAREVRQSRERKGERGKEKENITKGEKRCGRLRMRERESMMD